MFINTKNQTLSLEQLQQKHYLEQKTLFLQLARKNGDPGKKSKVFRIWCIFKCAMNYISQTKLNN